MAIQDRTTHLSAALWHKRAAHYASQLYGGPRPRRCTECRTWPHRALSRSPIWSRTPACRLPGELDMICSTSEVAACCSSASTSFFCTSARALRLGLTRVLAFALVERSTRACVLLFAPLRDKITSSAQSLVVLASASLDHSSARKRNDSGIFRPNVFAVFNLIANWYLVGSCTGSSPGFAHRRTRSM